MPAASAGPAGTLVGSPSSGNLSLAYRERFQLTIPVSPRSPHPLSLSAAGGWMQQWLHLHAAAVKVRYCLPRADLQLGASGAWASYLVP